MDIKNKIISLLVGEKYELCTYCDNIREHQMYINEGIDECLMCNVPSDRKWHVMGR
jgi:hypothetical protein